MRFADHDIICRSGTGTGTINDITGTGTINGVIDLGTDIKGGKNLTWNFD